MNEKVLVLQEKKESPSENGLNLTLILKETRKSLYEDILSEFKLYNLEPFSGQDAPIYLDLNLFQMEEL